VNPVWQTLRDAVSLTVGAFILIHAQLSGRSEIVLTIVAAGLMGVPGALMVLQRASEPKE